MLLSGSKVTFKIFLISDFGFSNSDLKTLNKKPNILC